MNTETQYPLPVRLSKSQCSTLETTTLEAIKTAPKFTKTNQLEAMIDDFVVRMASAHCIKLATANYGTVCGVEETLAPLLELLEAALENRWPLHTRNRSPRQDAQHLEALHDRIPFLLGEVAKAHAMIDATKRAQRWFAFNDTAHLVEAVSGIASGTTAADTSAIRAFASGLGLDVQAYKPASWSRPERFVLQRSYSLSSKARINIEAIIHQYGLGSESAAIRMVLDYHGKSLPTILKPTLSPPPHEGDLDFIKEWTRNAGIALRNGRTPAVPVAIDLTAIFDRTLKDIFAVREKSKALVFQSTMLMPYHLAALEKWCDAQHSSHDLMTMLGGFKTLGVFQGNPTDVLKTASSLIP